MIVYVYCELKLISNRVTIVFSVVCDDVTADEFPHPSPGSRIVTRFEQDDLVQQVMLDRVDLPALDGRQRFLELRGQMSDVRRTERRTVLLVQQRDVGVREILGGRQDEELVPAVPEQFELKRSAMSTRSGGGGGGGSARYYLVDERQGHQCGKALDRRHGHQDRGGRLVHGLRESHGVDESRHDRHLRE